MWQNSNIWKGSNKYKLYSIKFKDRLNTRNACYHPVQNFSFSRLVSKNQKIMMHKTTNLPVALYWCKISCLALTKQLHPSENMTLGEIFGPKREEEMNRRMKKIT